MSAIGLYSASIYWNILYCMYSLVFFVHSFNFSLTRLKNCHLPPSQLTHSSLLRSTQVMELAPASALRSLTHSSNDCLHFELLGSSLFALSMLQIVPWPLALAYNCSLRLRSSISLKIAPFPFSSTI